MASNQRSFAEKDLLVDLVVAQLTKPTRSKHITPKIDWRFVTRKFNESKKSTQLASNGELGKLWRELSDAAMREKFEVGDAVMSNPLLGKICQIMSSSKAKKLSPKKTAPARADPQNTAPSDSIVLRRSKRKLHSDRNSFLGDFDVFQMDFEEEGYCDWEFSAECKVKPFTKKGKRKGPAVPQVQKASPKTPAALTSAEAVTGNDFSKQTSAKSFTTTFGGNKAVAIGTAAVSSKESIGGNKTAATAADTEMHREDLPRAVFRPIRTLVAQRGLLPMKAKIPATVTSAEAVTGNDISKQTSAKNFTTTIGGNKATAIRTAAVSSKKSIGGNKTAATAADTEMHRGDLPKSILRPVRPNVAQTANIPMKTLYVSRSALNQLEKDQSLATTPVAVTKDNGGNVPAAQYPLLSAFPPGTLVRYIPPAKAPTPNQRIAEDSTITQPSGSQELVSQQLLQIQTKNARDKNLYEADLEVRRNEIDCNKDLHLENLRRGRELHELRKIIDQEVAQRSKLLHDAKMANEQLTAQHTLQIQDAQLRSIEMSNVLTQQIHDIQKQTALLKQEEAATNNKIAALKLKQIEIELKQLEEMANPV